MDNHTKSILIENFNLIPVPHGIEFDNGKRWCSLCESPIIPIKLTKSNTWKEKSCPSCSAVWPEFVSEYNYRINNDPDFLDDFDHPIIH